MKSLNQLELDHLIEELNESLEGAQLQEIRSCFFGLVLSHFRRSTGPGAGPGGLLYLFLDLDVATPMLVLTNDDGGVSKKNPPWPMAVFLNAHFKNMYFKRAERLVTWGRVVQLVYGNSMQEAELELHLIPKQGNLVARCEGKQMHFVKPRELVAAPQLDNEELEARSFATLHREWVASRMKSSFKSEAPTETMDSQALREKEFKAQLQKQIEKKQKAMLAVQSQLEDRAFEKWQELGAKIKAEGLEALSANEKDEILKGLKARSLKLGEAIEFCFSKAKQLEGKRQGTLQRMKILAEELMQLQNSLQNGPDFNSAHRPGLKPLSKKSRQESGVKTRKFELSESLHVYIGKSALDNLQLLRQSRSWDIWLHLKDYPGAYGIIRREKNQNVSHQHLLEASRFVAKSSLSSKEMISGAKISVIWTECKNVRPIKGDKPGRVNYQNVKEILVPLE